VKSSRTSDNCHFCQEKVYVVERMSAEGKFFHRACFRCDYCNILLRLGSYVYHREGRFANKFFCIPHSTENALEKYKYNKKVDEIQAFKEKRRLDEELKMKAKKMLSPKHRERIKDIIDRGATPERAEFEVSIDLSAEDEKQQIMDEDEWTDLNFGTSTNCANTSEDSLSDLETDNDLEMNSERPLTADQTREFAREWRARQRYERRIEEVRYTDQEYEDSSDCELHPEVHKVNRIRRRGRREVSSSDGDTSDDSDDTDSTEDSSDEELREIERRDNNPFNNIQIPKIVVEPNSPLTNRRDVDPKYVSQVVPLTGPTPPGTGLYKPSMSSLAKYQYKTPDFTNKPVTQGPHYRTLSGAVSNNLKKNWVSAPNNSNQMQKKVDQSEIDARLKSLMDRLSSQQSLLKPADKPSVQMQHYLDSTGSSSNRKLSDSGTYVPYKPGAGTPGMPTPTPPTSPVSVAPPVPSISQRPGQANPVRGAAANNLTEQQVPEPAVTPTNQDELKSEEEEESDSESLSSDSDDSLTTNASDVEVKPDKQFDEVPEIMINLAEPDPPLTTPQSCQSESQQPTTTQSDEKAVVEDVAPHHSTPLPKSTDQRPVDPVQHMNSTNNNNITDAFGTKLLIEEDPQPTEQVKDKNATTIENINLPANNVDDGLNVCGPTLASPDTSSGPDCDTNALMSVCDTEEKQPSSSLPPAVAACDNSKTAAAIPTDVTSADNRRRNLPQRRPSLLRTVVSIKSDEPVSVVNYELVDQQQDLHNPLEDSIDFIDDGSSPDEASPVKLNSFPGGTTTGENELEDNCEGQTKQPKINQAVNVHINTPAHLLDGPSNNGSDLLIVSTNFPEPGESSTDPQDLPTLHIEEEPTITQPSTTSNKKAPIVTSANEDLSPEQDSEVWDILVSKDSNEKKAMLNQHQQKQSNIVHDLIMGIPRQRRVRQPRNMVLATSVPVPPNSTDSGSATTPVTRPGPRSPPVALNRPDTAPPPVTLTSPTKSVNSHRQATTKKSNELLDSNRSTGQNSPIARCASVSSLPPTPITNPEKFGIRQQDSSKFKASSPLTDSPTSPSHSQTSVDIDNLDGIVSEESSPVHSSKKSSSSGQKKGRGFMAAVTSMFRGSPSPVTSPDSSKASPARRSKDRETIPSAMVGSASSAATQDLVQRTRSLSLQQSLPSTPPVPLSRTVQLDDLPADASLTSLNSLSEPKSEERQADAKVLKHIAESSLPQHLVERLEKRLSSRGQVQANRAAMARVRRIQEIQRDLGVIEVQCAEIERDGVELEKKLTSETENQQPYRMAEWYRLLGEKNRLIRKEQELMVESKQLELVELADREECQLGSVGGAEATVVLDKLARIAEQREQLEEMMAKDRERYRREDIEIQRRMQQQGISATCGDAAD